MAYVALDFRRAHACIYSVGLKADATKAFLRWVVTHTPNSRSDRGIHNKCKARTLRLGPFEEIFAWILRGEALQFPQQFSHPLIHRFWNVHLQFDVLVPAMPRLASRRDAFVPQTQLLAAVSAWGNAQERTAVYRGDLNFRAERRLGHRNGDNCVKIIATAVKKGMRLHVRDDV